MTATKMKVLTLLICSATMAFSDQMENFESGIRKFGPNDLVLWGMSYASCLQECRSRQACRSINVNQKIGICRLNFEAEITKSPCGLYVYSEKRHWKKKTLCDRQKCSQEFNVKTNSDCTCVVGECMKLAEPVNCTLMGNGRLIGHKVAYVFRNAQNFSIPIGHRRCLNTSVWSGEPINCTGPVIANRPPVQSTTEPAHTTELTTPTETSTQTGPNWSVSSTEPSTVTPKNPSTSTVSQSQTLSSKSSDPTTSTAPTESSAPTKNENSAN